MLEQKRCCSCGEVKAGSEFKIRLNAAGARCLDFFCKVCSSKSRKPRSIDEWLTDWKARRVCFLCKTPGILRFVHFKGPKLFNIAANLWARPKTEIRKEMKKCRLVCEKCWYRHWTETQREETQFRHMKRTWNKTRTWTEIFDGAKKELIGRESFKDKKELKEFRELTAKKAVPTLFGECGNPEGGMLEGVTEVALPHAVSVTPEPLDGVHNTNTGMEEGFNVVDAPKSAEPATL